MLFLTSCAKFGTCYVDIQEGIKTDPKLVEETKTVTKEVAENGAGDAPTAENGDQKNTKVSTAQLEINCYLQLMCCGLYCMRFKTLILYMQYNCCVKSVVSITVDYCVSQKIRTPN